MVLRKVVSVCVGVVKYPIFSKLNVKQRSKLSKVKTELGKNNRSFNWDQTNILVLSAEEERRKSPASLKVAA